MSNAAHNIPTLSRDRLLRDNLAALRASTGTAPDLTIDSRRVRLEDTPTGPSASVEASGGRWIRIHSARDPVREADRLATRFLSGTAPPLVVLVGAGLGYMLEAIERRFPSTRVLVIEPLPDVAAAMLARRAWQDWTNSKRLCLLVGPDYAGPSEAGRFIGAHAEDPPVLVAPVFEREFANETARAREVADRTLFGARANAKARRQFAPRYLCNTLQNMPAIAGSADVEALKGALRGVPAIVVAAGPSLDSHLEALRHAGERAVLIAVDTAVRPLLNAGIHPHLAVSVDPSPVNGRHLRNLPDASRTFLVGEGSLDPSALSTFDNRAFIFSVSDHHPWPWLRSQGFGRGQLRAWGSVLTSAFDLAVQAGCNPIVFAGADLAYTDHRPCCRGTTFEEDWADRVAVGESLTAIWRTALEIPGAMTVDGREGRPVQTASHLLAFRDWLVEQTDAHDTTRFINATGDGVLDGRRIERVPLPDVVASLPGGVWSGLAEVRAVWSRGRSGSTDVRPILRRLLADIVDAAEQQEPLATWLAFAGTGLSRKAVVGALQAALAERPTGGRPEPTGESDAVLPYAPERVALIRAAIAGDPGVDEAFAPASVPSSEVPLLHEAATRVHHLLKTLLVAPGPLLTYEPGGEVPFGTPASRAFPWNEPSRRLVREYEAALADLLVSRSCHSESRLDLAAGRVELQPPGKGSTPDPDVLEITP